MLLSMIQRVTKSPVKDHWQTIQRTGSKLLTSIALITTYLRISTTAFAVVKNLFRLVSLCLEQDCFECWFPVSFDFKWSAKCVWWHLKKLWYILLIIVHQAIQTTGSDGRVCQFVLNQDPLWFSSLAPLQNGDTSTILYAPLCFSLSRHPALYFSRIMPGRTLQSYPLIIFNWNTS